MFHLTGAAVVFLAACGEHPRLSIEIITPAAPELDPTLDDRVATIKLVEERTDLVLAEQPFQAEQVNVVLPRLPIGVRGDLRLELLDAGKRVLGIGRNPGASITPDEGTVVSDHKLKFYVRKPHAYVGSTRGSSVLDTTRTPRADETGTVGLPIGPSRVSALAALAQGRMVLIGTEGLPELHLLDTATNAVTRLAELPSALRRIVVDPTERAALLIQDGGIVPFQLGETMSRARVDVFPVADPDTVAATFAADGNTVYLVLGAGGADCAERSLLHRRSPFGAETGPPIELPIAVADIDLHPHTGNLVVASPCTGEVLEVDPQSGGRRTVVLDQLPGVTEVSVVRKTIVGIGSNAGARGVLQLHAKLSLGQAEEIKIAWPKARLELNQYTKDMTRVILEIVPYRVEIRDAAVAPGGDRILAAIKLWYRSTDDWCQGMHITSWGLLNASLLANAPGMAYTETKSLIAVKGVCSPPSGNPAGHEPTAVTILFGGS